jgi:PAS domain S-box-containing protein
MRPLASTSGWPILFWTAFERSMNPMALLDANRIVVAVNDAMSKMLGYAPEQTIGRRGDVFIAPKDWKHVDTDWNEVLRTGRGTHVRDFVTADGGLVRVHAAARSTVVDGRHVVLFVAVREGGRSPDQVRSGPTAQQLTRREREIISGIAMGRRAHEIADDLGIATTTVQTHVRNAMAKVGARSQAQLVAFALARGLLDPEVVNRQFSG